MSTHNLCFRAKIRKKVNPCTPQFHYIKVGCKGVFITLTCLHDASTGRCDMKSSRVHSILFTVVLNSNLRLLDLSSFLIEILNLLF